MPSTLAYAPTPEDLDEGFFDAPIVTMRHVPSLPLDEEEAEQGEP